MAGLSRNHSKTRRRKPLKILPLRRLVQTAFLLIMLWIGARHLWQQSQSAGTPCLDGYCPFGGVETLFQFATGGTFLRKLSPSNLVVLAATLATALFMGRAFCGWICPLGTVQEWLGNLARKLTGGRKAWLPLRLPPALDRPLRALKFAVLGLVVWASTRAVVPPLEPFCPLKALFGFSLNSYLSWTVLGIVIAGSLLVERFWCKYLCPLGAVLSLFNKISPLRVHTNSACVNCGRCGAHCGMDIDERPENIRSLECIRCLDCLDVCRCPNAIDLRLG